MRSYGSRLFRHISLLVLASLMAAQGVRGDGGKPEDLFFQDIPDVITPARVPQKPWHASSAVEVVTARTIERWGVRSVADLLRRLGGIDVRNVGTINMAGPRGTANTAWITNQLILLDGIPVNDTIFGSFDLGPDLPLNMIQRVEVVRGPGSSLYGANAYSGTINIITRKAGDLPGTKLRNVTGQGGTQLLSLTRGVPSLGTSWLLGGRGFFSEDWTRRAVNDNDGIDDRDVFARMSRGKLDLFGYVSRIDQGRNLGENVADPADVIDRQSTILRGSYRFDDRPGQGLVLHLYANNQDGSFPRVSSRSLFESRRAGANLQYTRVLGQGRTLVAGLEYAGKEASWDDLGGAHSAHENSAYFQESLDTGKGWTLTFGARFDDDSSFGRFLSPRFSAVRDMGRSRTLRLQVGRAFLAPNFNQQYIDTTVTEIGTTPVLAAGNADLEPEVLYAYEAGISHNVNRRLRYDLNFYYNRSYSRIFVSPALHFLPMPTIVAVYSNEGRSIIRGADLNVRNDFSRRGSFTFNYSFQRAWDRDTGKVRAYTPKHKANFNLDYEIGRGWSSHLNLHYVTKSERTDLSDLIDAIAALGPIPGLPDPASFRIDGFTTVNGRFARKICKDGTLALLGYNLTDRKYYEAWAYPQAGRTLMFELTRRF